MHQVEGVINFIQAHGMRDKRFQIDITFHRNPNTPNTPGSAFGGVKGRSQLPGMVEDAMKGDIDLEPFVTHTMSLDEINDAFDLMHEGKSIRTVIRY